MRPGFTRICGLINAIAGREIRTLQTFATADVNNVRIGRRYGNCANRPGLLRIENRLPGMARIRGLPHTPIHGRYVEEIRLVRDSGDGNSTSAAKGPDAAPAHL